MAVSHNRVKYQFHVQLQTVTTSTVKTMRKCFQSHDGEATRFHRVATHFHCVEYNSKKKRAFACFGTVGTV